MSMQGGYLTLLAYDNSLALRRKRLARQRNRKTLKGLTVGLAVTCALVFAVSSGAGIIY
jgi:hypothetical protein